MDGLDSWIGRQAIQHDYSDASRMQRLAALLDREESSKRSGVLPPLGHWLCFLPDERQSALGEDGHPLRTDSGILPNVDLPRRMWAGSRIRYLADVALDTAIVRTSTLLSATPKRGRSGDMLFCTVRHEIAEKGSSAAIVEEQDIVYRQPANGVGATLPGKAAATEGDAHVRTLSIDPVVLFRYSALTFNAHRIHYDRDYAREVEAYPERVVHGPLVATLLLDHFFRNNAHAKLAAYSFRAESPLFAGEHVQLGYTCADRDVRFRALGPNGTCMRAQAELAA